MFRHIKDLVWGPPLKDGLFSEPTAEERFYAKVLHIMLKPSRRFWFIMRVTRLAYWTVMLSIVGWLVWQFCDRALPIDDVRFVAEPFEVEAGSPVRVHYFIVRNKRCEVHVRWSTMDSKGIVTHYDPQTTFPAGPLGPTEYIRKYNTDPDMNSGPATLSVYKTYTCPGNYLSGIWPIMMEPHVIPFEVSAVRAPQPNDRQPGPGPVDPPNADP